MKWHSGDKKPKTTGWYIRDYRDINDLLRFPDFSADYFEADFESGFWYVSEFNDKTNRRELNDARFDNLKWAKIKGY
jgi:hypothetical protein